MKILDRLLIKSFLQAYLICFISLLSMYVVVDLFTNIDDLKTEREFQDVLRQIGVYYGYRVFQIFDRLSEAIVVLAAMFTIAWMQKHNELVPLLSAGVSTRRVIRPVVVGACLMLSLTTLNQELVLPRIANELFYPRNDPEGKEHVVSPWHYDPQCVLLHGVHGDRGEQSIRPLYVSIPGNGLVHLCAKQGRYVPPGPEQFSGGWWLYETEPPDLPKESCPDVLVNTDKGKYFLYKPDIDFDKLVRPRKWYIYSSTSDLYYELSRPDSARLSVMAVLFHMRLTRPLVGVLLVCLSLGVILRDQNRNVFISTGLCLLVCALLFGACLTCKFLGDHDYLTPALAAWLPVLTFAPLAFVLLDAVHT